MSPHSKREIIADKELFFLEQLTEDVPLDEFACSIEEYNEYLRSEAVKSQNDQMALTWLSKLQPLVMSTIFHAVLLRLMLTSNIMKML
jgi:hypothetical protein